MRRRQQRRAELRALVEQAQGLAPEELGRIMTVVLASALLGTVVELVLLVLAVRATAYAWRHRETGLRQVVRSKPVSRTLTLVGVFVGFKVATRSLQIGWLRRSVARSGAEDAEPS